MLSLLSIQKIRVAITVVIFCILNFVIYTPTTQASFVGGTSIMSTTSLNTGLVGYWTFDGKDMVNGVALDKSGRNNNANLINISSSTFYALGKIGQGLKFDGTNDYVKTTTWTNIAGAPITTSGWIKMASTTNTGADYFYSERGNCTASGNFGFGFYVGPSGKPGFVSYGVLQYDSVTSPRVDDNKWHYVVAVYDLGFDVTFYVDGVKYDKILHSANMTGKATCAALIGAVRLTAGYPNNIAYFTKATFDDIRIYNRALSLQEIRDLYNLGSTFINDTPTATGGGDTLKSGLIGWWTFDGADLKTNVADSSGNANNGRLVSFGATSTAVAAGRLGQSLKFDGVNDYVHVGDVAAIDTATALSECAWTKASSVTTDHYISAKSNTTADGFLFFRDDIGSVSGRTDTYTIYIAESSGASAVRIEGASNSSKLNAWTHVCFTYLEDATNGLRLYVNGIEDANSPVSTAGIIGLNSGGNFLTLGSGSTGATNFNGSLDDIRIYNRALSITEIKKLYNTGSTNINDTDISNGSGDTLKSGLVGWWTFDGPNLKTNVADSSGNGNTGYLTSFGATNTAVVAGKIGQGLKFDGVNDYVKINDTANLTFGNGTTDTPFSVSSWIYMKNSDAFRLISKAQNVSGKAEWAAGTSGSTDDYFLGVYSGGGSSPNLQFTAGAPLNDQNKWIHITYVYDGKGLTSSGKIYRNGVYITTTGTATGGSYVAMTNTTALGTIGLVWLDSSAPTRGYANGAADDIRVYNRALSPQEIQKLYNLGR